MVCAFKIRNDEVDVVGAEVVDVAELDRQCDLAQGVALYPGSMPQNWAS
jgi:hypothetical protein